MRACLFTGAKMVVGTTGGADKCAWLTDELGFDAAPGAPVAPTAAPVNAGKSRIWGIEVENMCERA